MPRSVTTSVANSKTFGKVWTAGTWNSWDDWLPDCETHANRKAGVAYGSDSLPVSLIKFQAHAELNNGDKGE